MKIQVLEMEDSPTPVVALQPAASFCVSEGLMARMGRYGAHHIYSTGRVGALARICRSLTLAFLGLF